MSEEIKPAMAAEDWQQWLQDDGRIVISTTSPKLGYCVVLDRIGADGIAIDIHGPPPTIPSNELQTVAALALYGQPYGFTHAMVDALHRKMKRIHPVDAGELQEIADRIAALLPPRTL